MIIVVILVVAVFFFISNFQFSGSMDQQSGQQLFRSNFLLKQVQTVFWIDLLVQIPPFLLMVEMETEKEMEKETEMETETETERENLKCWYRHLEPVHEQAQRR